MNVENLLSRFDLLGRGTDKPLTRATPGTSLHWRCFWALLGLYLATALVVAGPGEVKAWAEIDWLDVAGEGMVALAALLWLYLSLLWRPPGPVSYLLMAGFSLLSFGFFLDALDEIVRLGGTRWGGQLESVVTPFAVIMISCSLISLSQEQRILRRQQFRREANYRDHRVIDPVTDLYDANYCRQALTAAMADVSTDARDLSLWMIDLKDFDRINRRYGFAVGDAVLNRVASSLVAAAPSQSLVCRYAGDCFVVLSQGVAHGGYQGPCQSDSQGTGLQGALGNLLQQTVGIALFQETGEQPDMGVRLRVIRPEPGESANAVLQRGARLLKQSGVAG